MISYQELIRFRTFDERFRYLQMFAMIGEETFGSNRYLNQKFYKSIEWKRVRRRVILRDNGCDLGLEDYPIKGGVYIHHLNPITETDILDRKPCIFDLDNLVCCSLSTHNLLHFGTNGDIPDRAPVIRFQYDTIPWKTGGKK